MKFSELNEMGLYDLNSLIRQLHGLSQAFYFYIDSQDTGIPDPKLRKAADTVFEIINAAETVIAQTCEVADRLTGALEKFEPEVNSENEI